MGKSAGLSRRDVLKLGAAGATALGVVGARSTEATAAAPSAPEAPRAAGTDAGGYEVLANAFGFGVDIPGCPQASRSAIRACIDELAVDADDPPTASLSFGLTPAGRQELQAWADQAIAKARANRDVTLAVFRQDRSVGRAFVLHDCVPVDWAAVAFDTSSTIQTETLRVKVGRIEFKV